MGMPTALDADVFLGCWNVASVTLPNGKPPYTGTVQIRRVGQLLDLQWDISDGPYLGIGLIAGDRLLVACAEQRAGLGVAFFPDPATDGEVRWSTPELQGRIGAGQLSAAAGGPAGDRETTWYLPDGSIHGRWSVQVHPAGELHEVTWRKGEVVHNRGLGLAVPGGLAVGWYPDLPQLALLVYRLEDPRLLSAVWALGGFNVLGDERLERI
jgi:hypothetical protein